MCGIVGYIGSRNAQPILLGGLEKLEYRGYDSAGVAVCGPHGLQIRKAQGRLAVLASHLKPRPCRGHAGIGHTRWATHGGPSDVNAHPHTDPSGKIAVVHNGIVENEAEIREELLRKGNQFVSETDTEVIAHLIAECYEDNLLDAVLRAAKKLAGAFSLGVLSEYEPDKLVVVRQSSPLIIGIGKGEHFISSDIPAILDHTRDVIILEDGEAAVLTADHVELFTMEGKYIAKDPFRVDWDMSKAEKAGYEHFMIKEISEQPKAYLDTMRGRLTGGNRDVVDLGELDFTFQDLQRIEKIQMVACGSAYHAALAGKYVIERLTRIPVEVEIASEYRYRQPIITKGTLVIAVSQSGETADTLAAMREAKRCGAQVLAVTNVVGSSAAREADHVLYTWAGPEISVASTKAYTTQLIALYMLAIYMAQVLGSSEQRYLSRLVPALQELPGKAEEILAHSEAIRRMADQVAGYEHLFFIGRGLDYAAALEGSLKLKEISYIHSEAYAAGELKHGTLALIEEGTPVIALACQKSLMDKMISNIKEIRARGAYVFGVTLEDNEKLADCVDSLHLLPDTDELFAPALAAVPLQLLAYYTAVARGHDVDKPRNLAKSVTVE
jgi:glucosamine--fructose-6-phosphate aminotransferase (isomerizing)